MDFYDFLTVVLGVPAFFCGLRMGEYFEFNTEIKDLNDLKESIYYDENIALDEYLTDSFVRCYVNISRYITCAKKINNYLVNHNMESDSKKCYIHNHYYYSYDSYISNEYTLEEIEMYVSCLDMNNANIDKNTLIDMLKVCNDYINYGYELDSNLRVFLATSALSDIYNQKYNVADIKIDKTYYEELASGQNDAWKYFEEEIKENAKREDYKDINIEKLYELITTGLYSKETCDCLNSFNYCDELNDKLSLNMNESLEYTKKIYEKKFRTFK